jgi:hypothetical protein
MKLSLAETIILVVGVFVVTPILAAILTPSVDAISMVLPWLGLVAVFLLAFVLVRRLIR